MSFTYKIKKEENLLNISLVGSLINKQQVEILLDDLTFELSQKSIKVVINLSKMEYMNSTGLNILINILTLTRNKGGEVVLANIPARINKLLVITKLDSVFEIKDSIANAKKKLLQ